MTDDRGFGQAARELGLSVTGNECTIEVDDVQVRMVFVPPAGKRPASLSAYAESTPLATSDGTYRSEGRDALPQPRPLTLRREVGFDRFGKALAIAREVQTGDDAFDAGVFVDSDDDDATVRRLLSSARLRRAAVEAVQHASYVHLFAQPQAVHVTRVVSQGGALSMIDLTMHAKWAADVARGLPKIARAGVRNRLTARFAVAIAALLVGIASFPFFAVATTAHPLLLGQGVAARWGLALFPVLLLAGYFGLRGRATSHLHLMIFLIGAAIGSPCIVGGTLVLVNGDTDAPNVEHLARIERKTFAKGKNSTTYYLHLASWLPTEKTIEVHVPKSTYDDSKPGDRVIVTTQDGRLGWPIRRGVRVP